MVANVHIPMKGIKVSKKMSVYICHQYTILSSVEKFVKSSIHWIAGDGHLCLPCYNRNSKGMHGPFSPAISDPPAKSQIVILLSVLF